MQVIDKTIPLPAINRRVGQGAKYPFWDMVPGDSVFFPNEPKGGASIQATAARMYGARSNMRFIARSVDGGVRIWRKS